MVVNRRDMNLLRLKCSLIPLTRRMHGKAFTFTERRRRFKLIIQCKVYE